MEEREKTDTDKDRDRTGNNGRHRERKEKAIGSQKGENAGALGVGGVGGWRANGKEQRDNSMQQTLIKHLLGAEEQGAGRPLRVSEI